MCHGHMSCVTKNPLLQAVLSGGSSIEKIGCGEYKVTQMNSNHFVVASKKIKYNELVKMFERSFMLSDMRERNNHFKRT